MVERGKWIPLTHMTVHFLVLVQALQYKSVGVKLASNACSYVLICYVYFISR